MRYFLPKNLYISLSGIFYFLGLLIFDLPVGVLDVETAHIVDAQLHALFLGRSEQLVLEGVDAGIEALRIKVKSRLWVGDVHS